MNPALVVPDKEGKPYTVRYDAVNAMLLNEFLKEHRRVEEQGCAIQGEKSTISQLKITVTRQDAIIAQQQKDFRVAIVQQQTELEAVLARLKEQDSKLQRVSDQLAAASPFRGELNVSKFTTGRIRRGGTAPQIVLNNQ